MMEKTPEEYFSEGIVEKKEIEVPFVIPSTKAEIEKNIHILQEALERDEENMERKRHISDTGIPQDAVPQEVANADVLYQKHREQLGLLEDALNRAA